MLEIAKALFANSYVIVLDEATAPLPKNEVNMLFSFVRRLSEQGVAFIYISHYIEEVFELCANVTVMRDGKVIGDYCVSDLDQPELIRLISGVKVERFHREHRTIIDEKVLEFGGLTKPGVYQDINFFVRRGEIVGLTGLEGCGKAELAHSLFGLETIGDGQVLLEGKPYFAQTPEDALKQGVAYLPRDRHKLGIIGARPVSENITISILQRLVNKIGLLRMGKEKKHVQEYIQKLGVKTPSPKQLVQFLSGGNQQKVVFAKLASTEPKILLLDEPTQGVDVQAKVEIMKIVDQLSRQGVSAVLISEEIREMIDICDRILVMYRGSVIAEFKTEDPNTTPERILLAVEGDVRTL